MSMDAMIDWVEPAAHIATYWTKMEEIESL